MGRQMGEGRFSGSALLACKEYDLSHRTFLPLPSGSIAGSSPPDVPSRTPPRPSPGGGPSDQWVSVAGAVRYRPAACPDPAWFQVPVPVSQPLPSPPGERRTPTGPCFLTVSSSPSIPLRLRTSIIFSSRKINVLVPVPTVLIIHSVLNNGMI